MEGGGREGWSCVVFDGLICGYQEGVFYLDGDVGKVRGEEGHVFEVIIRDADI